MPLLELPFARLRSRWRRSTRGRGQLAPLTPLPPLGPTGVWFGTASVVAETQSGVRLRLHDDFARTVDARWALPYRYRPTPQDVVWATADAERAYVLGVLRGAGRSELVFQGDTTWTTRGTLRLVAGRGVRIVGERVTLRAQALRVVAAEVHAHARRWTERVVGLRSLRAGSVFRHTAGLESVAAREVAVRAETAVKFDGGDVVAIS